MKVEFQLLHIVIYLALPFAYQPALELSHTDNERGGGVLIIPMCEQGLECCRQAPTVVAATEQECQTYQMVSRFLENYLDPTGQDVTCGTAVSDSLCCSPEVHGDSKSSLQSKFELSSNLCKLHR